MSGVSVFNKLPRTGLYFRPLGTLLRTLKHLPEIKGRGEICCKFENDFRRRVNLKRAVTFPHARVALHFILEYLNLEEGTEVLMTPITVPDIVNVFLSYNLKPVFADLEENGCNIDLQEMKKKISAKTGLIFITHLCGIPSRMPEIMELANRHKIKVIEDASQALGASIKGSLMGSFGFASIFSISTLKTVATYHGGMALTNDDELALYLDKKASELPLPNALQFLEYYARDNAFYLATDRIFFTLFTYYAVKLGEEVAPKLLKELQSGNILSSDRTRYALQKRTKLPEELFVQYTEYQADLGLLTLPDLDIGNSLRRELSLLLYNKLSEAGLEGVINLPDGEHSTFWRFPFFVKQPDAFRKFLRKKYIDSSTTNLICMSRQDMFGEIQQDCPNAECFTDKAVFLPVHSGYKKADMISVAKVVMEYFENGGR